MQARSAPRLSIEGETLSNNGKFIGGLIVGLGLAYLLDPERGANRRALVRDKATRVGTKLSEGVDEVARELRNRASGAAAELRSRMKQEESGRRTPAGSGSTGIRRRAERPSRDGRRNAGTAQITATPHEP